MPKRNAEIFLLLGLLLFAPSAHATMVQKMDLAALCQAAGVIVRGVVVDIEKVTVAAGGGEIPATTYHLDVSEHLKGPVPDAGNGQRFSFTTVDVAVIDMPRLAMGQDYLLLLTSPGATGLSSMVGLGQGTFKVYGAGNSEMAVNELNNVGLLNGLRGPLPYRKLTEQIRATF